MYKCPSCKELGYGPNQKPCPTCLGWGVLVNLFKECTNCKGKGCYQCKNTGKLPDPRPFVDTVVRSFKMEDVREAVDRLRTGWDTSAEEGIDNPYLLAVAGRLVALSQQHVEEFKDEPGAWLANVLGADELVVEPSGLWVIHGKYGARVERFHIEA